MMADKPDKFPEWGNNNPTDPVSGQLARVEPPQSRKDDGWSRREIPPRQWLNWLAWKTNQWIVWLEDRVENLLGRMTTVESDFTDHIDEMDAHGATSSATGSRIMLRKADGRGGDIEPGTSAKDPLSFEQATNDPENSTIMKRDQFGRGARVNDAINSDQVPAYQQIGLRRAVATDWIAGTDFHNGAIDVMHAITPNIDWLIQINVQIRIDQATGGYDVGDIIYDVWSGTGNTRSTSAVRVNFGTGSHALRIVNHDGILVSQKAGGDSILLNASDYSIKFFVMTAVASAEPTTHIVL